MTTGAEAEIDYTTLKYIQNAAMLNYTSYVNVSSYATLMNKYGQIIEDLSEKVFGKSEGVLEAVVGFIENIYNIKTIRDEKKNDMWIEVDDVFVPLAETYIMEVVRIVYKDVYNPGIFFHVCSRIKADTMTEAREFFLNDNPNYILFKNGIYDINRREMVQEIGTKKPTFFSKIPVEYIQDAKPNLFLNHLNECLKDQKDIDQIQEIFGYCLYRRYSFAKIFLWLGDGRNGKGVTSTVLSKMLGDPENIVNVSLSAIEKYNFSLIDLHGKHANIIGELEQKSIESTEKLKSVTGSDPITANRKGKSSLTFCNYAKFIIMGNELFPSRDTTDAFFQRVMLIQFPYQFISQFDYDRLPIEVKETGKHKIAIPNLADSLTTDEELKGVLAWAVEGLHRLLDRKQFTVSKTTEETKRIFLQKSNNITSFIEDFIEIKYNAYIEKSNFKYVYSLFCERNMLAMKNDKTIYQTITDFGATPGQKNNRFTSFEKINTWDGIRFKESATKELVEWAVANGHDKPELAMSHEVFIEQRLKSLQIGDRNEDIKRK